MISYSNEHLEEQVTLWYTAGQLGGTVSPQVGPVGIEGDAPGNFFLLMPKNRRTLAHRKNEILVLLCTMSAANMFTISWIKSSSFVYVKHVFLDQDSKVTNVYSSNQKLLLLFKNYFSLNFHKKRISKKIFSNFVTIIVYKHNLKPLRLFDATF